MTNKYSTHGNINTNYLVDLLIKATHGPWVLSGDDAGNWNIRAGVGTHKSHVAITMPKEISNYDRRLMGMSWSLGVEVLRLRKILEDHKIEF